MKIYISRCKHCGVTYSYQASGYGCHDILNSPDYCPDCQRAIIDALNKIPKKIGDKYQVFEPNTEFLDKMMTVKKEEETRTDTIKIVKMRKSDFKHCAEYFDENGREYFVEWNDNIENTEELCITIKMEYDLVNHCFNGKPWEHYEGSHRNKWIPCINNSIKIDDVPTNPLPQPTAKLSYMEF